MSIDSSDPNCSTDSGGLSPVAPMSASCGIAETSATMAVARPSASGGAPLLSPRGRDGEAGMTVEARRRIGRNLRLLYAEVLNQPLPDRFDALLADLVARSTTGGSS